MRVQWLLCASMLVCFPFVLCAQPRAGTLVFKASELMPISQDVAGDSAAWPVVVALAERYLLRNEFHLSASAQKRLRAFADLRRKVNAARPTFNGLVQQGAPVLAEVEFLGTRAALQAHDKAVADANLESALQEGEKFLALLPTLSALVAARRTEAIEAKLKQKTGIVDKRKGLLGAWQSAQEGDLLAESDGVRTGVQSSASLAFIDGSTLFIRENTTAVVRTARLDRLDKTLRADVVLVKGALLSQLSKQAQESGTFTLSAGNSEVAVRSAKFWASVNENRATRLANYNGIMQVRARQTSVTLQKNQGTVVLEGKAPLPPVELLPAPRLQWSSLDTVIFRDDLLLRWNPIANAVRYQIELSSEYDFSRNVQTYSTASNSLWLKKLPNATRYVRLQAIDKLGLRGADSPSYRILRSPDTEPPFLLVRDFPTSQGDTLRRYTTLSELLISGETEPGAMLLKDGAPLEVAPDGKFDFTVQLENTAERFIQLSALDAAQNRRTRWLHLVPIRLDALRQLVWSCATAGDTLLSNGVRLQVRGKAYPYLTLTIQHGERTYSATADAKGNWALAIDPVANQSLILSFESPDTKTLITVRTYFVK